MINNAILLASKYQSALQKNLNQYQAIILAIDSRKRPIYMSMASSIFGILPLMLLPGEGAEIYRGLAAVIIDGMTFSALFSLSFIAALCLLPSSMVLAESVTSNEYQAVVTTAYNYSRTKVVVTNV